MLNDIEKILIQDPDDENKFSLDLGVVKRVVKDNTNEFKINKDNKFKLALDCDDMIVNISDKWFEKIKSDATLGKYVKDKHMEEFHLGNSALCRSQYYLNYWLGMDNLHDVDRMLALYYNDETFYDNLEPTPYLNSLFNMIEMVETIHIITVSGDNINNPATLSKAKWLKEKFSPIENISLRGNEIDMHYHFLPTHIKKGQFIKQNKIFFNSFADDSLNNVYDVIENSFDSRYEIIMPFYGFNHLVDLERIKNANTDSYIQFVHNLTTVSQADFIKNLNERFIKNNS
ncbi:MAG: hypothetical protein [Bacteriophage sp.]|nr:MAG: hypothetical protein [Bacteriophage sp.]